MKKLFLLSIIILSFNLKAQFNCQTAIPFCTGSTYIDSTVYNNTSSSGSTSFGCITNFSNNCYFYSQAQTSGPITLQVSGSIDMDLISWGGVSILPNYCFQISTNTLACSSTTNITESITFNVISGQYYLICATSPATTSTQFTLSQTAGSGALCINACSKAVATPSICYVTSNNNLNNEIYFNNYTSTFKKGTVIYRENSSSLWDSIGYVPSGQPDKFIDLTSNTNQQAYRYAIAHLDSCNNVQVKSNIHKTILLQSSLGTGTQINLSWNLYQGLNPTSYYIFRGTTSSNMQVINTVSGSTTAYTDLNPPAGLNLYKVAILTPTNCTSSAAALDTIISSNYRTSQDVGIAENEVNNQINVYPNPAINNVHINTILIAEKITFIDLTGKEILSEKPKSNHEVINLENLSSGVYFIRVSINNNNYHRKIVVQKENQ
jgi:hypothetical protein